jgi:hypothetical protein
MTDRDSEKEVTRILKKDVAGRVRTSVRQREALIDHYERSGLSGPKFAAVAGICYQTFAGWMQKRLQCTTSQCAIWPGSRKMGDTTSGIQRKRVIGKSAKARRPEIV